MEIKNLPVQISHRSKYTARYNGALRVTDMSRNEKMKNGFKYLFLTFNVAALCAFIPVLHFVLVPGCLLIGMILFYQQISFNFLRLENSIPCPDCQTTLNLKKVPFNWPMKENCFSCRAQIKIEPV